MRGKDVRDSPSPPRKPETWAGSAGKAQTLLTTHGLSDLAGGYLVTPDIASILSSKGREKKDVRKSPNAWREKQHKGQVRRG